MTQDPITLKRVSCDEMRKIFNEANYWQKTLDGELIAVLLENRQPSLIAANEPFCTNSQMISYRDTLGYEVARVHQYSRPDGTIGASKRPDPKRVLKDGVLYRLTKKEKPQGEIPVETEQKDL